MVSSTTGSRLLSSRLGYEQPTCHVSKHLKGILAAFLTNVRVTDWDHWTVILKAYGEGGRAMPTSNLQWIIWPGVTVEPVAT